MPKIEYLIEVVLLKVILGPIAVGNGCMTSASSFHYLSLALSCVQVELRESSNHMLQGTWYTPYKWCSAICCGNFVCEAEGVTGFRDFHHSCFKSIVRYFTIFAIFPAF